MLLKTFCKKFLSVLERVEIFSYNVNFDEPLYVGRVCDIPKDLMKRKVFQILGNGSDLYIVLEEEV